LENDFTSIWFDVVKRSLLLRDGGRRESSTLAKYGVIVVYNGILKKVFGAYREVKDVHGYVAYSKADEYN